MHTKLQCHVRRALATALAAIVIGSSAIVLTTLALIEGVEASSHLISWEPVPEGTGPTVWTYRLEWDPAPTNLMQGPRRIYEGWARGPDGTWLPIFHDQQDARLRFIDRNRRSVTVPWFLPYNNREDTGGEDGQDQGGQGNQ